MKSKPPIKLVSKKKPLERQQDDGNFRMVATTMLGLEAVLADELQALGAKEIKEERRAVSFWGDMELLYRCNLWLRTAIRILKPLTSFVAHNEEEFYQRMKKIPWENWLNNQQTFAISSVVHSRVFTHSQYMALKTKDAIVDRFREKSGSRPSVNTKDPDIQFHIHIREKRVGVSIDSSGVPLFKRGFRQKMHQAPINEALAAGMVLLSGWKGDSDFLDPMCGSATIAIEAALIAYNIPPNLRRERFSFESWKNYRPELLNRIMNEARSEYKEFEGKIYASDKAAAVLSMARANIHAAGLDRKIKLTKADLFDREAPSEKGIMIFNPPYGERLGEEDTIGLYQQMGDQFKRHFEGWEAWVISSDLEAMKHIGLKPSKKIPLQNGKLDCRFMQFELYAGSRKGKKLNQAEEE